MNVDPTQEESTASEPEIVPVSEVSETPSLLEMPLAGLGLKIQGSPVEPFLERLVREIRDAGLRRWVPRFYLTDEWGCPSGHPIIGVPFYLADRRLMRIERERNDLETPREIMMYLRHEAGHAINYAYRLYQTAEWRDTFGPFRRRYRDDYRPTPFSREYVRHLSGWYAQKHPDEDFAETFAVWMTPELPWRERYEGWPALRKLEYMDRTMQAIADRDPVVRRGRPDITVEDMEGSVGEVFAESSARNRAAMELNPDDELVEIFLPRGSRRKPTRPAWEIVEQHRTKLVDKIAHWTGVRRPIVRAMVDSIVEACRARGYLGLKGRESDYLVALTAYGTALAMNYMTRGKFRNV